MLQRERRFPNPMTHKRRARWRAVNYTRRRSSAGQTKIVSAASVCRPQFPFTVPNFLDCLAGVVPNSYPNIDLL
jgi:hypothetical protein